MTIRIRDTIKISATAIFILLCALIPSWLAPASSGDPAIVEPPPTETVYRPLTDFSARAALYHDYADKKVKGVELTESDLDEKTRLNCEEQIGYILGNLVVDEYPEIRIASHGVGITQVSDGNGGYIRLVRFFREWYGDWQNWLDLVFDADTLDIYYIYISSECLQNHSKYTLLPFHNTLADFMADYTGYGVSSTETSYGEHMTLTCTYSSDDGNRNMTYDITGWNKYSDSEPSRFFDFVILCEPDTNLMQQSVEKDTKT